MNCGFTHDDWMLYLAIFGLGLSFAYALFVWVGQLPEPYASHEGCDERFERMVKHLRAEIAARDADIRRLMDGGA